MKCDVWKPCSDQRWQGELLFSFWRFFEQSAFVNIHQLCYWPTIHNLISKKCPKFQVLSSHFVEVNELIDEHWAKIVRSETISTPFYHVECLKMYRSKVCVQEFWYFVPDLESLTRTTILHAKKWVAGCATNKKIYRFFFRSTWIHASVES